MNSSNPQPFVNRVAVITGAAIGIGFEIARQLVRHGASVVLNDIDPQEAQNAVEKLKEEGGKAIAVPGDSGELSTIEELIATAVSEFGRLDYAIANAGITTYGSFLEYPVERLQKLLKVNIQGTFFLAQKAAQQLIEQGDGGRILLMGSNVAFTYHADLTAYAMSKGGIATLTKYLGVELAHHGITVNALAPGATLTERTRALNDGNYAEIWSRIVPTGEPAAPSDIAQAALYFLSTGAAQVTGQTLIIDGGWTSISPQPDES